VFLQYFCIFVTQAYLHAHIRKQNSVSDNQTRRGIQLHVVESQYWRLSLRDLISPFDDASCMSQHSY